MKSMTAFARNDRNFTRYQLSLEIKTVNHRYLDINIRLPEEVRFLEVNLRELIAKKLSRGRVDVFFKMEYADSDTEFSDALPLNMKKADAIAAAANAIYEKYPGLTPMSVSEMLQWKGVLETLPVDEEALAADVTGLFSDTLADINQARESEGDKTRHFLLQKTHELREQIKTVNEKLPEQSQELKNRLKEKLEELRVEVDHDRFEQEVVYQLNRIDVNEEVERLEAHVNECEKLLNSKKPVGRKLDFMMQELQREANTLGTKSTLIELKNAALAMKVAIEQIREQIQNIE